MSFTLLQWNCMYSEDLQKIADFIRKVNPDIVCLQELTKGYHAGIRESGGWIARELGYHHHCVYGQMVLPDGAQTYMGNGILSRLPFSSQSTITLQEAEVHDEKVVRDARFYLEASIEIEGQGVSIGTTHLPFHPRFRTTPVKQHMVDSIIACLPHHSRYILAGDFNTTPKTKAAKTFRQNNLKNAGPALTQATWTTKPFAIGAWSYSELQYRLDYVHHRQGVRPTEAIILKTELSDHLPILVKFELN